jgi:hypothetical protein
MGYMATEEEVQAGGECSTTTVLGLFGFVIFEPECRGKLE